MRIGWGFDAHRFGGPGPLKLAGVVVAAERGLVATSDGDVLAHAVADALLGASGAGDLGTLFPSSDHRWHGADSMELLARVVHQFHSAGLVVVSLDTTIVAETVRIDPHREEIRASLARCLEIAESMASVKATTTDGMGFVGADEGMAAIAVVAAEQRDEGRAQ